MRLEAIPQKWRGELVIVAAPGPSLTPQVAERCRGHRTVVVQDAYRLLPWADALYGCDAAWWRIHRGCPGFAGQKWSTHDTGSNCKRPIVGEYGMHLVEGVAGNTFSTDPARIRYGGNSGFQAVNLALLLGGSPIVLVGFDMKGTHFFGEHPKPLRNTTSFRAFLAAFNEAAAALPAGVDVINATPRSALKCFSMMPLDEALSMRAVA